MSEENDGAQEGEGIKNLRKEFDALKKQLTERDQELAGYKATERKRTVAEVLKAKGLPEKAASLYNGDDASEEAVGKWLEDFGDVFGLTQQQDQQAAEQQAEINRLQQAAFGQPPNVGQLPNGQQPFVVDPVEALQAMASLPYEQLVEQGYLPNVKGTMWDTHGK
jgi:hypothetical protein